MLKWSFNFTSMNFIPLSFYERSTLKRINMTSVLTKNPANIRMHETTPDIKSSVQKSSKVQFITSGRVLDSSVEISKR